MKYVEKEEYYRHEVEKDGEYEYVRSYRKGDVLPNGKVSNKTSINVRHKYCGNEYIVATSDFITRGRRCGICCRVYENSLAYHIEVELGLKLEDVWDFEKNTVNPHHVSKGSSNKVWIKCQEKDYHGSYEIYCYEFSNNGRCPYCSRNSGKVHPKDSFAQYHIDNTDKDFLEKYWDYEKNTVSPWEISPSSYKKVWIKCQNEDVNEMNGLMKKDYHPSYDVKCGHFTDGSRCSYCGNHKVHPYDSFGYHNLDKAMSWHPDNDISPFRIARNSGKKYKFMCHECYNEWRTTTYHMSRGQWCPSCNESKGESAVRRSLIKRNIEFVPQKKFEDLLSYKNYHLSYDFYLPKHNLLIEYQGEQHRRFVKWMHGTYENYRTRLIYDEIKRDYANKNNIRLLEIWYEDFDNIEKILSREI
ncbi:MAG: zinc-ribbon domain-containing protein [Cetobacterium sp.]